MITKATINNLEEISSIENACFPVLEAASKEALKERILLNPNYFYILQQKNEIISFINGILSNDEKLSDEMYENIKSHQQDGKNYIIFGVDTNPQYRHQGNASKLMNHVISELKKENKEKIILTCKKELISFYQKFGFQNEGISESTHGDVTWYQMSLLLKEIK